MNQEEGNSQRIVKLLDTLEQDLRTLRGLISSETSLPTPEEVNHFPSDGDSNDMIIEGIFDGERMVDFAGKSYQVSPNYASKSKLVEGDPLKLYITHDGKFYYKQLGPVERKTLPGVLRAEGNHYVIDGDDGKVYSVLTASVTYYMSLFNVRPEDRVMIMVPAQGDAHWAVIDNVL